MSDRDIRRFLELKAMFDKLPFIPSKVGMMLAEDRLQYQLEIDDLNKQLIHALQTGGEYLEVHKQIH